MKHSVTTVCIILFLVNLYGEWQENGIPIRAGENILWNRTAVTLSDNTVIVVWSDARNGNRNIYANKIDVNGNMLWEDGINITNDEYLQIKPTAAVCSDNSVIISWVDKRIEFAGDVYAQKISSEGELLWEEDGVPICTANDSFSVYYYTIQIQITSDANGGAYLVWTDARSSGLSDLYGSHILDDGSIAPGWDVNGNPVVSESGTQSQHRLCSDGTNGVIVVWSDSREIASNIYMQRFSPDGTMLWNENGTLLCDGLMTRDKPKVIPDRQGNFIFTWRDKRNESDGDIYAQKIDLDGNPLWGTGLSGIEVYAGDGIQKNPEISCSSDSGAFITWQDNREDYEYSEVYSQKLDSGGALLWNPEGVSITPQLDDYYSYRSFDICKDNFGGVWLLWHDARDNEHNNVDLYIQHLDSTGEELLETDGMLISEAPNDQCYPIMNGTSSGEVFAFWANGNYGDFNYGANSIAYQILETDGSEILPENGEVVFSGLSNSARNLHTLENSSSPIITWEDYRNDTSQIYMQTLNNDGSGNSEQNGIPITSQTGSSQLYSQTAKEPDANEFGVIWHENRLGNVYQAYAQIMQTDGTMTGEPEGILLSTAAWSDQNYPKISAVNNNGNMEYYAGWSDGREMMSGTGVYAQKIAAGEIQWDEECVLVLDSDGDDTLKDIVENFYIIQNGLWNDLNIVVQKLNEDGNIAEGWPIDGLVICDAPGNQNNPQCLMIPEGLLIVWEDYRNGDSDIYAQLMDRAGNFLWQATGVPLVQADSDQYDFSITYDNDIYMAWVEYIDALNIKVYAQKFNLSAEPQWEETGVLISEQTGQQREPNIIHRNYPNHEIVVFWSNAADDYTDLYSQTINEAGELGNGIVGEVVCDVRHYQQEPTAVLTGNDVIVFWEDQRASDYMPITSIYAQKLSYVDAGEEVVNHVPAKLYQNYPNPFNPSTTISFQISNQQLLSASRSETATSNEQMQIEIFNIKGQQVDQLRITNYELGINEVVWNAERFASGVYFYKLTVGNTEVSKKMVLIK